MPNETLKPGSDDPMARKDLSDGQLEVSDEVLRKEIVPVTYKETMEYLRKINKVIAPLLRQAVSSVDDPGSREMIDYFFEPRYEKPKGRVLLALLAFETVADLMKELEPALEGAPSLDPSIINNLLVAIRLLDGTSVLHDDIIDHDQTRDGRESLYKKYGHEKAMMAGEKAHELANIYFLRAIQDQERSYDQQIGESNTARVADAGRSVYFDIPDTDATIKRNTDIHSKVIHIFNSIWDEGYSGQRQDYDNFGKDSSPTLDDYEQRLYLLTGQFHEKVMLLGAYAAGIEDEGEVGEILNALGNYGKYYGIAAQLRNDLLDFVPEGGFNNSTAADRNFKYQDFVEGKQTMPIILAKEKCSPEEYEYIFEKLGRKDITDEEKKRINEILVSHDIFKDCERRIFELSKLAISELDKIPGNSRKKDMLRVCALIESNMIKRSFAGEDTAKDVKLDSLSQLEEYFQKP